MRAVLFEGRTWLDYEALREKDPKLHKSLRNQIKEMTRSDPSTGTGKPEKLKHEFSGLWSRRISQKDRLVYKFDDTCIYIFSIGGHYDLFK